MAVPNAVDNVRMVVDYRAAKDQVESVPAHMINVEQETQNFAGTTAFCALDLLQGYWQCLLADDAREIFTIATATSLFTLTGFTQEVLSATACFPEMVVVKPTACTTCTKPCRRQPLHLSTVLLLLCMLPPVRCFFAPPALPHTPHDFIFVTTLHACLSFKLPVTWIPPTRGTLPPHLS